MPTTAGPCFEHHHSEHCWLHSHKRETCSLMDAIQKSSVDVLRSGKWCLLTQSAFVRYIYVSMSMHVFFMFEKKLLCMQKLHICLYLFSLVHMFDDFFVLCAKTRLCLKTYFYQT